MNYIQKAKKLLATKIDVENDLLDLYTLLLFTKGVNCQLIDVHDAWSVWRNNTKPEHVSIIPFEELTFEIQEMDREYTEAIQETAKILKN